MGSPRLHTVFCAECTAGFDYKAIGAYYSHNQSGIAGGITRLLACDADQLLNYKGIGLGPTYVHKNHGRIKYTHSLTGMGLPAGARHSDTSPTYNKPASIMHWALHSEEVKHIDFVLYLDADMVLRTPIDLVELGARRGVVVSEHVAYLDNGIRHGLPRQFIAPEAVTMAGAEMSHPNYDVLSEDEDGQNYEKQHAAGGWYHLFHIEDIKRIAPRWLHWCKEMRLNPQKYWSIKDPATGALSIPRDIKTGDVYAAHGEAPWIAEMYGYVFAAAEAGVRHVLTRGLVVYPGDGGGEGASIIHYGLPCSVGNVHLDKKDWNSFDVFACSGKTLGMPPMRPEPGEMMCAETIAILNDAMCEYYEKPVSEGGCGFRQSGRFIAECPNLGKLCASEDGLQGGGRICSCSGRVRYGYGERWSERREVETQIECSNREFGDVFPNQNKLCICEPAPPRKGELPPRLAPKGQSGVNHNNHIGAGDTAMLAGAEPARSEQGMEGARLARDRAQRAAEEVHAPRPVHLQLDLVEAFMMALLCGVLLLVTTFIFALCMFALLPPETIARLRKLAGGQSAHCSAWIRRGARKHTAHARGSDTERHSSVWGQHDHMA